MNSNLPLLRIASVSIIISMLLGCVAHRTDVSLPESSILERDQLVIRSDFHIPSRHRLIEELALKRMDMSDELKLPLSNEPIHVYVFKNEEEFHEFLHREHPDFPKRRAFFVKNDTTMKIYAYWGDQVGEDLRHETAHGYLHSVIPNLPLWLDEGIAEFYELPRGEKGLNRAHVYALSEAFRRNDWKPDLETLENLDAPENMNQLQYAESWLWVHFLLEGTNSSQILQDQLARLRMSAESEPMSKFINQEFDEKNVQIIEHLKLLAEEL